MTTKQFHELIEIISRMPPTISRYHKVLDLIDMVDSVEQAQMLLKLSYIFEDNFERTVIFRESVKLSRKSPRLLIEAIRSLSIIENTYDKDEITVLIADQLREIIDIAYKEYDPEPYLWEILKIISSMEKSKSKTMLLHHLINNTNSIKFANACLRCLIFSGEGINELSVVLQMAINIDEYFDILESYLGVFDDNDLVLAMSNSFSINTFQGYERETLQLLFIEHIINFAQKLKSPRLTQDLIVASALERYKSLHPTVLIEVISEIRKRTQNKVIIDFLKGFLQELLDQLEISEILI